nr:hypothetical protein pSH11sh418-1_00005 [Shigella sonnei]
MTIMASTWGKTREICTRNQAILKSAIEGWAYVAPRQHLAIPDAPG